MPNTPPVITNVSGTRRFAGSAVALQAVVVNAAEQILLLASPTRHPDGAWQVVSGALEAGETVLEGTLREVREELGAIQVRPLGTVHVETFHYDAQVQFMIGIYSLLVYEGGDVWNRMQVRIDEVHESVRIIHEVLDDELRADVNRPCDQLPADRTALSAVEGWRGEIIHWIRTGPKNTIERCKIKDPSLNNWPALVEAVQGNIIADFPVINKSFNLSYSGTDR